ncbi:MAG: response regulator transcription factor [Candidatus Gorgyraea atricola]|nr:response regulator transcription factor [Candidatus Gorgyraea atricola]
MKNNTGQKILVADSDSKTVKFIKEVLVQQQHAKVLSARTADVAVELAWRKKPDMIIVNTELVDLSGWDVLGILKKNEPTSRIPFIMMDKVANIDDEIRALNSGADDYIAKPLKRELFLARIKAVFHRCFIGSNNHKQNSEEEIVKAGNIVINMSTHMAYIKGKQIDLTPKEFALLYLFIKKQGRVLNRVFLSGTIWEREYFETSHTIDKHIANLRKKLGKEGKRIETLHTIGYKFQA